MICEDKATEVVPVTDRIRALWATNGVLDSHSAARAIDLIDRLVDENRVLMRTLLFFVTPDEIGDCRYDEDETACLTHDMEVGSGLCFMHGLADALRRVK
jgi:hypothetical protein